MLPQHILGKPPDQVSIIIPQADHHPLPIPRKGTASHYHMSRQNSRAPDSEYRRGFSVRQGDKEADKGGPRRCCICPDISSYNVFPSRSGCKASVCSAVDLKELMAEDPLMKRSLEMREMRSTRQHKISITSISTDVTDVFNSESENGWGGERTV